MNDVPSRRVMRNAAPIRTDAPRRGRPRLSEQREEEDAAFQGAGAPQDESMEEVEERGRVHEERPEEITRRTRAQRNVDRFAVPQNWKKRAWDYQFWVHKVMGQEVEGTTEIWEGGWRPVYWKDVPQPWAPGAKAEEQISRGGQCLYTRPMRLTEEAKREEYDAAERQKMDRIRSAQEGRVSGQEGLADIKGVRPVSLGLSIEGEVGVQTTRTPTQ